MSFDRRLGASIGALLTMVAGSGAVTAYACSYSPVTFRPASELVPLDGPIVVEVVCQETDFCEKGNISDATVTGPSGPVPGTFELVRSGEPAAFLVFRPSAALEADQGYTVRISEPVLLGGEPQAFEVRADGAFGWTDWGEPSWAFDSVTEDAGERFCCFPAQACFDHCFTEARAVKATLTPALPTAPRYGALSYALRWTEADGSVKRQALQPWLRWSDDGPTHAGLRAVFEQPAERYCATLEARDLASGAMHEFSHCENADPTVSVGTQHEPLFDEARFARLSGPARHGQRLRPQPPVSASRSRPCSTSPGAARTHRPVPAADSAPG